MRGNKGRTPSDPARWGIRPPLHWRNILSARDRRPRWSIASGSLSFPNRESAYKSRPARSRSRRETEPCLWWRVSKKNPSTARREVSSRPTHPTPGQFGRAAQDPSKRTSKSTDRFPRKRRSTCRIPTAADRTRLPSLRAARSASAIFACRGSTSPSGPRRNRAPTRQAPTPAGIPIRVLRRPLKAARHRVYSKRARRARCPSTACSDDPRQETPASDRRVTAAATNKNRGRTQSPSHYQVRHGCRRGRSY